YLGSTKAAAVTLAWHSIPPMHTGRYDAGAEWSENTIHVIGGFDSHGAALSSVESYDLDHNRWTAAPPIPTARGDFGIYLYGRNNPILVGGADSHGKLLNDVAEYNADTNHWYQLTAMPQARRGLAAAWEATGLY